VKISDYGSIEKYRKTTSLVKQKQARKSIDDNKILNNYVEKYQDKEGTEMSLFHKMSAEIFRGIPRTRESVRKKRALQKKFHIGILRGKADPVINSFISAWTNEEKLETFKSI